MAAKPRRLHFCIVTQVYPPDPAAVGQHLADVSRELCRRGHRVTVLTADRGYDDSTLRYARVERRGNLTVLRLPFCSFGKGSIATRLLSGTSLLTQAALLTLVDPRITSVLVSTIPHLAGALGIAAATVRRLPFCYWLMDLNPDQIVALGKVRADSKAVKAFDWLNRQILAHATTIVALDEDMARRFRAKSRTPCRIEVLPPWAVQDSKLVSDDGIAFRIRHNFGRARVIMHAGNHSLVHPLETLLNAIDQAREAQHIHFAFIGGGIGKPRVEEWARSTQVRNVTLLPYQPRNEVPGMLSAADVHVVPVGNDTVGIVHPSKIYGALAAGRPVIVIGPHESPAARLVREFEVGWHVSHGDIQPLADVLRSIDTMSDDKLQDMKTRAAQLGASRFSQAEGVKRFCSLLLGKDELGVG